jgi:hypothetical protein
MNQTTHQSGSGSTSALDTDDESDDNMPLSSIVENKILMEGQKWSQMVYNRTPTEKESSYSEHNTFCSWKQWTCFSYADTRKLLQTFFQR